MLKKQSKTTGRRTNVLSSVCASEGIDEHKVSLELISRSAIHYVYLVTSGDGKQYVLKGQEIALPAQTRACVEDEYNLVLSEMQYVFQEYYLTRVASTISEHFVRPVGVDTKAHLDRGNKEAAFCIEMVTEYGGEPLGTSKNLMQILNWMLQSAVALFQLHSLGISHMDIKPENMVYNSDSGILKIIDLGSGKEYASSHKGDSTVSGVVRDYTKAFAPPEVVRRVELEITSRCVPSKVDVYCWGAAFYAIMTGEQPEDMEKDSRKYKLSVDPRYYSEFVRNIHESVMERDYGENEHGKILKPFLAEQIEKCISFEPDKRPNFATIVGELAEFATRNDLCKTYLDHFRAASGDASVSRLLFGPDLSQTNKKVSRSSTDTGLENSNTHKETQKSIYETAEAALSEVGCDNSVSTRGICMCETETRRSVSLKCGHSVCLNCAAASGKGADCPFCGARREIGIDVRC